MRETRTWRAHRRTREETEPRDRWLVSYADLVTLLLALFIVLYAAADRTRARLVARAVSEVTGQEFKEAEGGRGVLPAHDALVGPRQAVRRAFELNERLRARASVTEDARGLRVSLAEAGFFAPGDARVREDALELIDTLVAALGDSEALVRVEGHTDSTPISNARYPSNWELSAARASAVLARLTSGGLSPARLSVAGYAGEHPVADNATPQGRALNRRVDVVVLAGER